MDDKRIINEIKNILFPKLEIEERDNIKCYIDHTVISNLESVLTDIKNGHLDKVAIKTLSEVINKINNIKILLNVNDPIDEIIEPGYLMIAP